VSHPTSSSQHFLCHRQHTQQPAIHLYFIAVSDARWQVWLFYYKKHKQIKIEYKAEILISCDKKTVNLISLIIFGTRHKLRSSSLDVTLKITHNGEVMIKPLCCKANQVTATGDDHADQILTKLNSVALVRKRTIPTERPPLVCEVSANCCG
jgi:hypothetical protein